MADVAYRQLHEALKSFIPESRIATDPLRTLAYGTDASFYRLIPRIVIRAGNETEVSRILRQTGSQNIPVTFRAAGTSLSGQAISNSVLLVASDTGGPAHHLQCPQNCYRTERDRHLNPRILDPLDPFSLNAQGEQSVIG